MPSQRLIRRQSLAQWLSSYPQDLLLSLNETYELLEWDSLSDSLSIPIGVGMNAIYLLARLDQGERIGSYRDKDVFNEYHLHDSGGWFDGASRGVHIILYLLSWVLVAFSIANAVYCFTKRKNYRVFDAKPITEPTTPNARKVTIDSPITYSPGFFSSIFSLKSAFRQSALNPSEYDDKKQTWELSIWDPTCLANISWFSPLHVLIIEYLAPASAFATIFLLLLNTAQLSLLISYATAQQKDKTTLYTQVLSEYNTKFIEPRISVRKRDIGTSTPTTSTPDASPTSDSGQVEIHPSMYGATGASLEGFRRKYGPVQHSPLRRSACVGPDVLSPKPSTSHLEQPRNSFDLWNAGGRDFPSPTKPSLKVEQETPQSALSKSSSTPAFVRPPSRGPTFLHNSPVKMGGRTRHSGGNSGESGDKIPGIRRW